MDNTQRRTTITQSPAKQLAAAYLCVAKCNHYMIGIVHPFDEDLWDDAEEILINGQNALRLSQIQLYRRYDLALEILQRDRDATRSRLDR